MRDPRPYPAWWHARARDRRALLDAAVDRLRAVLPVLAGVRGALIFGSYARGEVAPESDLDLILVQETELPQTQRGDDFRAIARLCVPYDLIVYTPEQYRRLGRERAFVVQAIAEGIWIDATPSA